MSVGLIAALKDVREAFAPLRVRDGIKSLPIPFWLDMLQRQIDEAREHVAAGKDQKALAEIADCFSVGWQALEDNTAGAEDFIVHRVRTRIIPRVAELAARDLPKVRALDLEAPCEHAASLADCADCLHEEQAAGGILEADR